MNVEAQALRDPPCIQHSPRRSKGGGTKGKDHCAEGAVRIGPVSRFGYLLLGALVAMTTWSVCFSEVETASNGDVSVRREVDRNVDFSSPMEMGNPSSVAKTDDDIGSNGTTTEPFNSLNPHEAWCPYALCSNSPMCKPCERRFIMLVALGRSGSTSLMRMLDLLPGVRMSGENNNAMFFIHQMIENIFDPKFQRIFSREEAQGPWGHGLISNGDLACPAQRMIEALNQPPRSVQVDMARNGSNDGSTILGFKTIRALEGWKNDRDFISFFQDNFPCSRVIINISSDIARQSSSQKKNFGAGDVSRYEYDDLAKMNTRVRDIANVLGTNQSYVLDSNIWFKTGGHVQINDLFHWLGFEDCSLSTTLHDHKGGYTLDNTKFDLGGKCRFVTDVAS